MPLPLGERRARADELLAPYAVKHSNGLGREHSEAEDDTRFPFQRDRDRILHTQAFRRLKHKTQVFVSGHGDHYRTRITHTLEVAQISRDIARTLSLNEDLAEAIALAHDLGHTPFGHAGEEAMQECLEPYGLRFEHNEQSLRIVSLLEGRTTAYAGLNLSREVLEGLMKRRTPHDNPQAHAITRAPSLEAQIVNLADEIAYTAHDVDDGLRAELFTAKDLSGTVLGKRARDIAKDRGTEVRGSIVHLLVSDVYETFAALIEANNIKTLDDVYTAKTPLVAFSAEIKHSLTALRKFLWDRMYLSPKVLAQADRGRGIIKSLFQTFMERAPDKVLVLQKKTGSTLAKAVKDYVAGMTDGFAEEMHKRIVQE